MNGVHVDECGMKGESAQLCAPPQPEDITPAKNTVVGIPACVAPWQSIGGTRWRRGRAGARCAGRPRP